MQIQKIGDDFKLIKPQWTAGIIVELNYENLENLIIEVWNDYTNEKIHISRDNNQDSGYASFSIGMLIKSFRIQPLNKLSNIELSSITLLAYSSTEAEELGNLVAYQEGKFLLEVGFAFAMFFGGGRIATIVQMNLRK